MEKKKETMIQNSMILQEWSTNSLLNTLNTIPID